MLGIREIDLMWKGQFRLPSGTDGRQFATEGEAKYLSILLTSWYTENW